MTIQGNSCIISDFFIYNETSVREAVDKWFEGYKILGENYAEWETGDSRIKYSILEIPPRDKDYGPIQYYSYKDKETNNIAIKYIRRQYIDLVGSVFWVIYVLTDAGFEETVLSFNDFILEQC